jgi:hypothetical protein
MNRSSKQPRNRQQLSESLLTHVNAYALAAGAAGVSIMALAQPADAEIIVTQANGNIPINKYVSIDLNHDGVPDFRFLLSTFAYHTFRGTLLVQPRGAGGVIGSAGGYAAPLSLGASIGPAQAFTKGKHLNMARSAGFDYFTSQYFRNLFGPWENVQNRFVGVEFLIGGETHYGWIRLTVNFTSRLPKATLTGYAYETVAGESIQAGQMVDQATTKLESAPAATPSLGVLALGSQGLGLWRRDDSLLTVQ